MRGNKAIEFINKNVPIKVIDSHMGSGKTTYLMELMANDTNKDRKYIYVTPFLEEVKRVKEGVREKKNRILYEPTANNPKGTKTEGFKKMIKEGKNIVTTHALLSKADEDLIDLIMCQDYVLILDEVMNVVEDIHLSNKDIEVLFGNHLIEVLEEPYKQVIWKDKDYNGRYNDIKAMCENNSLFYVNKTLMVWTLPVELFRAFSEVYISTYMFDYQIQKYYYDYFNLNYSYYHVEPNRILGKINPNNKYKLVETTDMVFDTEFITRAKNLLTIIDTPKLNAIGDEDFTLSKSWYCKNYKDSKGDLLRKNVYNFFKTYTKTKSKDNMWTTFKSYQSYMKGDGYSKGFIACNARATNDYGHKTAGAYLINRFLNPFYKQFFRNRGIIIDEDGFALSELLQWLWRGALRNNKPFTLYIPSARMRNLLVAWLNGEAIYGMNTYDDGVYEDYDMIPNEEFEDDFSPNAEY